MQKFLCIPIFLLAGILIADGVKSYPYPSKKPIMTINLPSDWQVQIDDEGSLSASPSDESLYLELFEIEDAENLDESLQYVNDLVDQWLDDFTLEDPKTVKVNGMKCVTLDGKGTDEEGTAILASVALFSPDDKTVMMLIYFGTKAAEKTHEDDIELIIAGLKPVK